MASSFNVPQQYDKMSLKDIFGKVQSGGGYVPDIGTLGSLTGLDPNQKLTAGQTINFNKDDPGSGEYKFLTSNFTAGPGSDVSGDVSGLVDKQAGQEAQLVQNFQNAVKGQEPLSAIYGRLSSAAGLPGLESTIGGYEGEISKTQGLLDQLEGNINERTRGTMTNEAQRQELLASESQPLEKTLSTLGTALSPVLAAKSSALSDINTQLGLEEQQQTKELQPYTTAISAFQDSAARQITGYTTDAQNKLQIYLTQLQNGQNLTMEQMKEASSLSQLEKQYQLQAEQYKAAGRYGGMVWNPATNSYMYVPGGAGTGTNAENTTSSDFGTPSTGGGSDWTISGTTSGGTGGRTPLGATDLFLGA